MLSNMSGIQFEEWKAYYKIRNWEQGEQMKKAKKGR